MENKTKKIDIKIIVIVIVTIIAIVEGIVIIASNKGNNTKTLTTEQCIGTWKNKESNSAYLPTLTLYKGGTGEAQTSDRKTILIQWKIEDNVLRLDTSFTGSYTSAYIIENNTMINVNGESTYNKVK